MNGVALEARGVARIFRRHGTAEVRAVDGVSLAVAAGACAAISGPSGCGKSTLLALLSALERPSAGAIFHDGRDLGDASEAELARLRRGIGFVFQNAPMIRGMPIWENITQPLVPRGASARERHALAADLLARLGVDGAAGKLPDEMSGGERQRAALARALATAPRLLVADEPTSQLDSDSAARVIAELRRLRAGGCTLLVASHDPAILALADEVHAMSHGRLAIPDPKTARLP